MYKASTMLAASCVRFCFLSHVACVSVLLFSLHPSSDVRYCDGVSVCLAVCLSACIRQKPHVAAATVGTLPSMSETLLTEVAAVYGRYDVALFSMHVEQHCRWSASRTRIRQIFAMVP